MKKVKKAPVKADTNLDTSKEYPQFTLLIHGMPWQIRFLNKEQILADHKCELKGCCIYSEYVIDLCYEGSLLVLEATAWHELAHAMTAYVVGSKDDNENKIDQEILANSIGDGMFQLMRQDFCFHPKYTDKQKARLIRDIIIT